MEYSDINRLRAEYRVLERYVDEQGLYTSFDSAHLFEMQQRQRKVLQVLKQQGFSSLQEKRILEVGCGRGRVLQEWTSFGASPQDLHGIDVREGGLNTARRYLVTPNLLCADGQALPYPDARFDIVLQFTAFSSLLDDNVKAQVASEMLRVLKRPQGMILWYDFWLNPTNKATRGIKPSEIRRLFPDCDCMFHRITLAPPLTRRLVSGSWLLCELLEKLRLFNSHYLVVIRPRA